jgi:hypothetical protein
VVDPFLELCLLREQDIVIGIGLCKLCADILVFLEQRHRSLNSFFDNLFHRLPCVKFRLLRKIAEGDPLLNADLPEIILVHTGYNPEKGALAGAIQPQHSDLRTVIEGKIDILQHLFVGRVDFSHTNHRKDDFVVSHVNRSCRRGAGMWTGLASI